LWGARRAEARVRGQRLAWSPGVFFQANRFLLEELVDTVLVALPERGPLLDLYAGVGLFSVVLRALGREVEAVELASGAVADARANLGPGARLHEGEVLGFLRHSRRQAGEGVIVDPPRSGLGPAVVQALVRRAPARLVYVSCDPVTLARDLVQLRAGGFELQSIQALDLFPGTFHVECVATLGRRSSPP
jgi:23S rRNA (uracil1939-C5)-methyltransferase